MKSIILAASMFLAFSAPAWAHNKQLNSQGCHFENRDKPNQSYHCHGTDDEERSEAIQIIGWVVGTGVVLWIIGEAMGENDYGYSPAPDDPNAIDWKFNTTPESAGIEVSIPFDLK